jgi:hypothetical protein
MNVNALPLVRRLTARAEERQRLVPREGPTALQQFYRGLGRFKAKANVPDRLKTWLVSKWSGYERLEDEVTEARYEADGRKIFRAAMAVPLQSIPIAGSLANAADTEGQAVLLWRAAQTMPDADDLKDVIETIALLKEAKATGQAVATPISLAEVVAGPIAEMVGKMMAKMAVKWIVPRLTRAILSADRDQLAHALHQRALAESKAEGDPPAMIDFGDHRHALYALVVLRVHLGLLQDDEEDAGYRDVRAAID